MNWHLCADTFPSSGCNRESEFFVVYVCYAAVELELSPPFVSDRCRRRTQHKTISPPFLFIIIIMFYHRALRSIGRRSSAGLGTYTLLHSERSLAARHGTELELVL